MLGLRSRFNFASSEEYDPTPEEAYNAWTEQKPVFEDADIDVEELALLFANERRNIVLSVLSFGDEGFGGALMGVEQLSHQVAGNEIYREEDVEPEEVEVDDDTVNTVRRSLRRTHLPRLEEHGIVTVTEEEFGDETFEVVESGENFRAALYALNDLAGYAEPLDPEE